MTNVVRDATAFKEDGSQPDAAYTVDIDGALRADVIEATRIDIDGSPANGTLYEVDFSTLANNTLTDGTESIDGHNWTIANQATASDTFEILNGTGLHYNANATSTAFSSAAQTSGLLYITIDTLLGTDFDATRSLLMEVQMGAVTFPTSSELCIGFWSPAGPSTLGASLQVLSRINSAGTIGLRWKFIGSATSNRSDTIAQNADVLAAQLCDPQVGAGFFGTFGSTWPRLQNTVGFNAQASANDITGLLDNRMRITMAFPTNGVSGTTFDVVIRRLRISMQ